MNKYLITFLFLNILFSELNENKIRNRNIQHFVYRQNTNVITNNNRNEEELIQFIQSTIETHQIPGLSISIVKDQYIIWEKQFGYANINDEIQVDENTMFILSSISKTITVTALMQLYEQNMFELDDDINNYLPFDVIHPTYPNTQITFKMLLSHTSGIKDNWNIMTYYNSDSPLSLNYYLEQYLTPEGSFYNSNLNFTNSNPGTNHTYTNNGAALIGLLVEEISNQSFSNYCNENIFEPLSMENTFWYLSEINNLNQVALPYQLTGGNGDSCFIIGCGIYDQNNPCFCDSECIYYDDCCSDYNEICGEDGTGSDPENLTEYENYGYSDYPSGQLRTSSNNLAKFMGAYMNGGTYNGVNILNSQTIELIKTIHYPTINSMQGLMWYYKNQNGRILFGHNGGDLGSLTEMFISFSDTIGIVLLSNSNNYNAMIQIENALLEFTEETNFIIIGDINLDSIINILDVILIINIIIDNQSFTNLADLNQDGLINIIDILQLINLILD
ncbi:MAG: hypothetical protein CMF96_00010 [Candidatus Marinimicrobia bacterium]|nr:hypothetical protein [Candidatus Neomarinimicrobiota bacterium]|tara:strand:+ start:182 stop:1690 length:1509 start_codon:yes stop_codon:yes gene_type:complete